MKEEVSSLQRCRQPLLVGLEDCSALLFHIDPSCASGKSHQTERRYHLVHSCHRFLLIVESQDLFSPHRDWLKQQILKVKAEIGCGRCRLHFHLVDRAVGIQ